jgi:hypothetical protein
MKWTSSAGRLRTSLVLVLSVLVAVTAGAACGTGSAAHPGESSPGGGTVGGTPGGRLGPGSTGYDPQVNTYAPDTPYTYVAKVKNILVGLPALDSEIQAVVDDPTAKTTANVLRGLIQSWMQIVDPNSPTSPMFPSGMTYYQEKMMVFFKLAFEQTQVTSVDFGDQFGNAQFHPFGQGPSASILLQNAEESFARTVLQLPSDCATATLGLGKLCGFQQSMTTQQFAMTTALKMLYALTDVWQIGDTVNGVTDTFEENNKGISLVFSGKTNYTLADSINPKSNYYMHWTIPGLSCTSDPVTIPASKKELANELYYALSGYFDPMYFAGCTGGTALITPAMYSDWTMVTITQPSGSEATTNFYDLVDLPTATSMVLHRPYVSFYTTPVFFANWQTNDSNTMRVTTNQSLIVALGQYINYNDPTAAMKGFPTNPPGLDTVHATSVCRTCHQFLDPTRSIFAQTFSWDYGYGLQNGYMDPPDTDPYAAQPGQFLFQGVMAFPKTIYDFGNILGTHPLFPTAWVQKLNYYVNSQPAYVAGSIPNDTTPTDPVFTQIVQNFQNSGYDWNTLVLDLLSSPLTTNAVPTTTTASAQEGVTVGVARRDHLCAALNFRLGFTDICGLDASTVFPKGATGQLLKTIQAIAGGLPSDGYGRGSNVPVLPTDPSLFYRSGIDNMCWNVAQLVVDPSAPTAGVTYFYSAASQLDASLDSLVTNLMGITASNPLYAGALAALKNQYAAGLVAPVSATPTESLESVFTTACMSPSLAGIGMQ